MKLIDRCKEKMQMIALDANTFGVPCTFCMSLYVVGLRQVFWVVAS